MKIEIAKSINDFLCIIHKNEHFSNNWYRGHKCSSYRLEPTLYREKKEIVTGKVGEIQLRHYEFKNESIAIKEFKNGIKNKMDISTLSDIDILYLVAPYDHCNIF